MADAPDGIVLRRHRDLEGRRWHVHVRRGLIAVVTLASLAQVEWAILETSGKVTFIQTSGPK